MTNSQSPELENLSVTWGFMASIVHQAAAGPFPYRCSGIDDLPLILAAACRHRAQNVDLLISSANQIPDPGVVLRMYEESNIKISALGTGGLVAANPGFALTSANESVRCNTVTLIKDMISLGAQLGNIPVILGSAQGWCWDKLHEDWPERAVALGYLKDALRELLPHAARLGCKFLYEVLNIGESNLFHSLAQFEEWVKTELSDLPQPAVLLDSYHYLGGWPASDIRNLSLEIGHVHLVGKHRRPIGRDDDSPRLTEFAGLLVEKGYDKAVIAECNPDPSAAEALRLTREFAIRHFSKA